MIRRLVLILPLLFAACAKAPEGPPPATVASVDLSRYAGTWHEIARFPNSFQDGRRACTNTTATYTGRPDGTVGVVNRCRNAQGEEVTATASAYAVEGSGNAKLRVTFFWPFYGDYWVIGLDPEYRWAVVGAPGRNYLWVLSRTAEMSEADYAAAVEVARGQGFEVGRLRQ